MTAHDRLAIADELRGLVHSAAKENDDIRSQLRGALVQLPRGSRATLHQFVLLWIDIDAGLGPAIAEYYDGIDVYEDLGHWQREACEACDAELQKIIDWALLGWSVAA